MKLFEMISLEQEKELWAKKISRGTDLKLETAYLEMICCDDEIDWVYSSENFFGRTHTLLFPGSE